MFRIKLYIGTDRTTKTAKFIYIMGDYETSEEAYKEIEWISDNSHYLSSLVLDIVELD